MALAVSAPHSREKHLSVCIFNLARAFCLDVLVAHRSPICSSFDFIWRIEILSVHKRIASVLLTSEIAHECERIVRLVLVCRSLRARSDDHDGKEREADHDHGEAQKDCVCKHFLLLHSAEKSEEADSEKGCHEECRAAVERKSERVDEEKIEICSELWQIRYDSEKDHGKNHNRYQEDLHILHHGVMAILTLLVIIQEHKGRDREKVEQVDTYREAHKEGDQHDPSVCIRLVSLLVPLDHGPEHKGCDQ